MALLSIGLCPSGTGGLLGILAFDYLFFGASCETLRLVWMVAVVQHQVGVLVDCRAAAIDLALSPISGCVLLS